MQDYQITYCNLYSPLLRRTILTLMVCAGVSNLCANNVQNHTDPVEHASLYHFTTHTHTHTHTYTKITELTHTHKTRQQFGPQYILTGIYGLLIINIQQLIDRHLETTALSSLRVLISMEIANLTLDQGDNFKRNVFLLHYHHHQGHSCCC